MRPLGGGIAWVAAENLHVTLKFLGQVEEAAVPGIVEALTAAVADLDRFDVTVRGLGAFPSLTRPRVIWAGAGPGGDALVTLAARVEAALSPSFPREERPFSSHVTLGRVREPRRDPRLAEALARGAGREFGRLAVDRVTLMRSQLAPHGARYSEIASVRLRGGSPP